jgi:hypothetical protein
MNPKREFTMAAASERVAAVLGVTKERAEDLLRSVQSKPEPTDADLNFAGGEFNPSKTQPMELFAPLSVE